MKGLRWWIAGLLMLATIINYLDRQCLSVTAPYFKEHLQIDEAQYSYIVTAFQCSYMVMQPITGWIIDALGTRTGFLLAVVWWSIANMLHVFARGWGSFAFFRALLGVGEAGNFPAAVKTVSEWFPARERTIATGIFNIGSSTGAIIAPPLVVWVILTFEEVTIGGQTYNLGWQAAFCLTGVIGFIWVALWAWFYHPPEQHPLMTAEELAHIRSDQGAITAQPDAQQRVWRVVLTQGNFWGLACARFLAEPAWQFFVYWIPMYLSTERHLNLKEIALFAWMPFLAADLGCLFGGFLSPLFQRWGCSVLTARKCAATVCALLMPCALLIGKAPSAGLAIFFFCVGAFAHQALSSTLLTLPADLFPKHTVATAYGLSGGIGYFGGMLFTLLVGWVVTRLGYGPLFTIIAFLDIFGAVALWSLVRAPRRESTAEVTL
jgi:MFS transporter, ACS family, hexuronate transporter